jgi:hypothetical protein
MFQVGKLPSGLKAQSQSKYLLSLYHEEDQAKHPLFQHSASPHSWLTPETNKFKASSLGTSDA